jgi:hypothetical protein
MPDPLSEADSTLDRNERSSLQFLDRWNPPAWDRLVKVTCLALEHVEAPTERVNFM